MSKYQIGITLTEEGRQAADREESESVIRQFNEGPTAACDGFVLVARRGDHVCTVVCDMSIAATAAGISKSKHLMIAAELARIVQKSKEAAES